MKDPKVLIDVSIITMTAFLGVPILVLGLQNITLIALTLYLIFPVLCLSCGVYCGSKNGFQLYYPVFCHPCCCFLIGASGCSRSSMLCCRCWGLRWAASTETTTRAGSPTDGCAR